MIHLLDFQTLDYVEISKDNYWRQAFNPIADRPILKEYMVIETEPVTPPKSVGCNKSKKHELADLWIIPTDKLGSADSSNWISTRTHLGKLFRLEEDVTAILLLKLGLLKLKKWHWKCPSDGSVGQLESNGLTIELLRNFIVKTSWRKEGTILCLLRKM